MHSSYPSLSNSPTKTSNMNHNSKANQVNANNHSHENSTNNSTKAVSHRARPSSLDRRRIQNRNRQERDHKSRSAHSLQESSASTTTDFASPPKQTSKGILSNQHVSWNQTNWLSLWLQIKNSRSTSLSQEPQQLQSYQALQATLAFTSKSSSAENSADFLGAPVLSALGSKCAYALSKIPWQW